ncbi:hypothetical protein ABVL22_004310 [Salmonella enterica]
MPKNDPAEQQSKSKTVTFRFPSEYIELLETMAESHNINRIHIIKAALLSFSELAEEKKMPYLMRTIK